jgi:hypothetical protein
MKICTKPNILEALNKNISKNDEINMMKKSRIIFFVQLIKKKKFDIY